MFDCRLDPVHIKEIHRKAMIDLSQHIQSILNDHLPADCDEAIREYLREALLDRNIYENKETLLQTLFSFLENEDLSRNLTDELQQLHAESIRTEEQVQVRATLADTSNEKITASDDDMISSSSDDDASERKSSKNSKLSRAAKRAEKKKRKAKKVSIAVQEPELLEDESSAWKECQQSGSIWGGRGFGGRGEYSGAVNSVKSNIHLANISLVLPNGKELLRNTNMDITRGHRYGLVGRNGIGKSSLLQRLAHKALPGMPQNMRVLYVQQQVEGSNNSAIDTLVEADTERKSLLREQEEVEALFDENNVDQDEINLAAERLGEIAEELDFIGADSTQERAEEILKGLGFTTDMMTGPTRSLSGGWRMRLALARALFVQSDVVLLDECTNHLDLPGQAWLVRYLVGATDRTFIIVSHDRSFLDLVCTDIIRMDHERLTAHVGNYSECERQLQEKASRESHILDAAERQRKKAEAFVQKQQSLAGKKSADQKKQRQAAMVRNKKLDRLGNYREDGKRYKTKSLKVMSDKGSRLAQKVNIEVDAPVIALRFPSPSWPTSIGENSPLLTAEDFSFGYNQEKPLVKAATFSIDRGSKIALVGANGTGKTTLLNCIAAAKDQNVTASEGRLAFQPNLRIGYVNQYSVESLDQFNGMTVVEYAEKEILTGRASAAVTARWSGNVRQYLGAFGLGGRHAHQRLEKLSGGERMRLCFATALADEPHMLLLDESTNHVDIETLESLSKALNTFDGSVLMVSHNQAFLSGFCTTLWVLEDARLRITHNDTESFDDMFSRYRSTVSGSSVSLSEQRQQKANLAKKATRQRVGVSQEVALL